MVSSLTLLLLWHAHQLALLEVLLPGEHHVVEAEAVLDEQDEQRRERQKKRLRHEDVAAAGRRRVEPRARRSFVQTNLSVMAW